MKNLFYLLLAVMVFCATSVTANAFSFTVFTNQSAWEAAAQTWSLENFNDGVFNDGTTTGGSLNTITSGVFRGRVNPAIDIKFDFGINAFGGTWNLAGPGGQGTGLRVQTGPNTQVIGGIPASTAGTFWGFVADSAFDSIALDELNPQIGVETFNLDDMVYSAAPVPEPSTILLLGGGLLGLGYFGRKRMKG